MITRIHKWGNSLGLRIPKALAEDVHLADGTAVEVRARNGHLTVTPVRCHAYSLAGLLAGVKRSNIHDEVELGAPIGREAL
jgi:antitoxin MazE